MMRRFGLKSCMGAVVPLARSHSSLDSDMLNRETLADEKEKPKVWKNPMGTVEYDIADAENVKINHLKPKCFSDHVALRATQLAKFGFDLVAGFTFGKVTEKKWIRRIVFLETVAGVPGFVAAGCRHFQSLRNMERDQGWINSLLGEAENERMHLLTAMEVAKERQVLPGFVFRVVVTITQLIFAFVFTLMYLLKPKMAHRTVGYIEEQAVQTYSKLLKGVDQGKWFVGCPVPPIAVNYWGLGEQAKFRDLVVAIRADEAGHRLTNHTFADMHQTSKANDTNPFIKFKPDVKGEPKQKPQHGSETSSSTKK